MNENKEIELDDEIVELSDEELDNVTGGILVSNQYFPSNVNQT